MKLWTTKEEAFLKENYGRMTVDELAEHLGRTRLSIKGKLFKLNITLPIQEYAVYKGDDLIATGTAEECAKTLSVSKEYVQWMARDCCHKRVESRKNPENATMAIKL